MPNTLEIDGYATNLAADDLEQALNGIDAITDIYEKLADEDSGWLYLVDRLREQHDKAMDAFCRIFKLGPYNEQADAWKKDALRPASRGWSMPWSASRALAFLQRPTDALPSIALFGS